jgi:hypothetical protein
MLGTTLERIVAGHLTSNEHVQHDNPAKKSDENKDDADQCILPKVLQRHVPQNDGICAQVRGVWAIRAVVFVRWRNKVAFAETGGVAIKNDKHHTGRGNEK